METYNLRTQQAKHQPPNLPHQLLPTRFIVLGHIQVYRRPNTQAESDQTYGQDAESSSRARLWNPVRVGGVGEAVAKDFVAHGAEQN